LKVLSGLLAAVYPFLIFAGLRWLEPRSVAALLGVTVLLRAAIRWRRPSQAEWRRLLAPALLVGAVLGLTLASNDARFLLFVPVLVNLALLLAFARTLRNGPPLVETFARMQHSDLTAAELRHCRNVTGIWCVFFVGNAAVAFWLAIAAELWWWTLYTGVVAYLLMAMLFAAEFVYRSWRFRRYEGSLVEPLFRRIFPRDPTA
jgi:uncharacterized membrane protein